jgi:hypothetical protein
MIGVSGSGTEDVEGVLEEECDVEGSDAARRDTLSPEILQSYWPGQMKHGY